MSPAERLGGEGPPGQAIPAAQNDDHGATDELADDPEVLREQIEETRQELGDTVAALAAKTDVKARAKEKAVETKEQLHDKAEAAKAKATDLAGTVADKMPPPARDALGKAQERARQRPQMIVGGAVAALVVMLVRRAKKRRRTRQ